MNREETGAVIDLLARAARMKELPRTGWILRGVNRPESVASHSQGVVLISLVLLDLADEELDRERALAMAVLHDLPEALMGDVPTPASRHLPPGAKAAAEETIFAELVAGAPFADRWRSLWAEFSVGETAEARLVRDADKLDMFLQATLYEKSGHREVAEFWERVETYPWSHEASRVLLEEMRRSRGGI